MKITKKKINILFVSIILAILSGFFSNYMIEGHNIRLIQNNIVSTLYTLEKRDMNVKKIVDEKCKIKWEKIDRVASGKEEFTSEELNALVKQFPEYAYNWFKVKENVKFKYFIVLFISLLTFFVTSTFFWLFYIESPKEVLESIELDSLMTEKLDKYILEIMHFKLEDFLGPDLYEKIKIAHIKNLSNHDKLDTIKEFISSGKVGFVFQKKDCKVSEYARWAEALDKRATKSIYSTNILRPSELFSGAHPKKREYVINHLQAVNDSILDKSKKIRIQILNNGSDDFYDGERFKEDYAQYFMNDNVTFKWCYENEIDEYFLGDYILYDELLVLKYNEKTKLLEILSGEVVDLYAKIFNPQTIAILSGREDFPPNM